MSASATATPRVAAMRNWEIALNAIDGPRPWGGSYTNKPTVERVFREITRVNKFPHLELLPRPGSRVVPATQERYEDLFAGIVIGYVKREGDQLESELVEHLNRDCKLALLGASRPAALIRLDDFEDEAVEFYESGHAAFWLPFTAHLVDALGR